MGASTWNYFVPYYPDISVAFQRLRQQVFEAFKQEQLARVKARPTTELEEIYQDIQRARKELQLPLYASREAWLREMEEEKLEDLTTDTDSGFHSILDVDHVAARPEAFAISPVSEQTLLELLGTLYPDHPMVEAVAARYRFDLALPGKWKGEYFIVYKDQRPDEWYIYGASGD